ncbi:hypothetical protein PIB30_044392 [Stylosanthes scabra]|uniref:CCHC-type domain-containing protein n=1 Tax=Stylosanthes scabra TaxID=79078 RepID=A0ABU6XDK3_9FABA|nr:hypothetical protein [Stylosanthes scabra]
MEEFPRRLILRRWCKDAKCHDRAAREGCPDPERGFRMRYGSLWSACMSVCFMAAQDLQLYGKAWRDVVRMARELEELCPTVHSGQSRRNRQSTCNIGDPKTVRSKGAPKARGKGQMRRRCRRCNGVGHDRRNCTAGMDESVNDEELESGDEVDDLEGATKRSRRG